MYPNFPRLTRVTCFLMILYNGEALSETATAPTVTKITYSSECRGAKVITNYPNTFKDEVKIGSSWRASRYTMSVPAVYVRGVDYQETIRCLDSEQLQSSKFTVEYGRNASSIHDYTFVIELFGKADGVFDLELWDPDKHGHWVPEPTERMLRVFANYVYAVNKICQVQNSISDDVRIPTIIDEWLSLLNLEQPLTPSGELPFSTHAHTGAGIVGLGYGYEESIQVTLPAVDGLTTETIQMQVGDDCKRYENWKD